MRQNDHGGPLAQPDLIDRIANALPEEVRADYYREMAHCRSLPESDEMLRILRAMQFLTVLIEQTPTGCRPPDCARRAKSSRRPSTTSHTRGTVRYRC